MAAATPVADHVRLSEVVGAMSYALDVVHGQPMGHAARSCAIGMRLAETVGLPDAQRRSLYYALLINDGSGYHLGLDARALTPGARILALAGVCEALSADRPYRAALEPDRVLAIMREDVPGRLDPQVFAALCAHLEASSEAV